MAFKMKGNPMQRNFGVGKKSPMAAHKDSPMYKKTESPMYKDSESPMYKKDSPMKGPGKTYAGGDQGERYEGQKEIEAKQRKDHQARYRRSEQDYLASGGKKWDEEGYDKRDAQMFHHENMRKLEREGYGQDAEREAFKERWENEGFMGFGGKNKKQKDASPMQKKHDGKKRPTGLKESTVAEKRKGIEGALRPGDRTIPMEKKYKKGAKIAPIPEGKGIRDAKSPMKKKHDDKKSKFAAGMKAMGAGAAEMADAVASNMIKNKGKGNKGGLRSSTDEQKAAGTKGAIRMSFKDADGTIKKIPTKPKKKSPMKRDGKTYAGGDQGKTAYQQLEKQENKKQQDAYAQARAEFGDDFDWKRDQVAMNKRIKEIKRGM